MPTVDVYHNADTQFMPYQNGPIDTRCGPGALRAEPTRVVIGMPAAEYPKPEPAATNACT